ncbi:hypothetical protein VSDG_01044 [Cytospora chrysosperma]|uniref:Helicase C-terminal domain-containing protein n=1 Tax=Cytospora chrysosperma TaxID=252740 RepID=A0A423WKT3_CYTCH|nr:hypothetical protein VSDG_01044 [Valsa sordida]
MASSDPPDASRPPAALEASKRPPTEGAESLALAPPAKKQRQDGRRAPFDLDLVTLACVADGEVKTTSLNMLAAPSLTGGELRHSNLYDYDAFRQWLSDAAGIARKQAMGVVLPNLDGENRYHVVCDRWSFGGLLGSIRNGVLAVPSCADYGSYLMLEPYSDDKPDTPPAVEEAAPEEAVPKEAVTNEAVPKEAAPKEADGNSYPKVDSRRPSPKSTPSRAAQTCIDLTRDDQDGSGEAGGALDPGSRLVSRTLVLTTFDEATFNKALQFFQVADDRSKEYTLKGVARRVHEYQLYAAYGLLMSPITTGVNGGLVAWDVGLGKTMLMLVYLRARARLAIRWERVQEEWADDRATKRLHLGRDGQQPGAKCPTQRSSMVECPCVATSDSRRICSTYLTNTPAVVIIPAGLAHGWLAEAQAVYEDEQKRQPEERLIHWYTVVSKIEHPTVVSSKRGARHRWDDVVERTSGEVASYIQLDEDNLNCMEPYITSGGGDARDVFLVGSKSVDRLQREYRKGTGIMRFTAGAVIMDEHQQYKGASGTTDTLPFTFVKTISDAAVHPVTLFTLCGTTVEEGPLAWWAPVNHFKRQWDSCAPADMLLCPGGTAHAATMGELPEVRHRYNALVRRIAVKKETVDEGDPAIRRIKSFLEPMMWCLRQGQRYRGATVCPLPPCREAFRHINHAMDETTSTAFAGLISSVKTIVQKKLREEEARWQKGEQGGQGERPTYELIFEQMAGQQQRGNFLNLQRASMYPYLAVLFDKLKSASLDSSACQEVPYHCQKAFLRSGNRDEALGQAVTWDLWPHLDRLEQNSAKHAHLRQLISEMLADVQTTPPDGSGKRHAILFYSQPVSAMLTYVLLLRDRTLDVKPLLLCSRTDNEERAQIVREMNAPCTAGDQSKVLIALTSIAAEGYNIQRANNIWFMELPVSLSKKEQAKGRAHRQGQVMQVNVVKFVEEGNLMERYGYDAMVAKETIARLVYGVGNI